MHYRNRRWHGPRTGHLGSSRSSKNGKNFDMVADFTRDTNNRRLTRFDRRSREQSPRSMAALFSEHFTIFGRTPISEAGQGAGARRLFACQWLRNCCTRRVVISKRPGKEMQIRWFLASAFAALWLFMGFAATSSQLHHCLHEDAPSSEHQCLFTKYAEGHFVSAPAARITLQIPLCVSAVCPPSAVVELPSLNRLLPPERAPPTL